MLLLASAGWPQEKQEPGHAKDDKTVKPLVTKILRPIRAWGSRRPPSKDPGFKAWAEEYEYLRKKAVKKMLVTIRLHGHGGEGKPLDIGAACEALMSPLLAPPKDRDTWALAEELLRLDPKSHSCWIFLRALLDRVRIRAARGETQWQDFLAWVRELRGAQGIDHEAALAVELLMANIAYEMGDEQTARRAAELALSGDKSSETLRLAARQLRSRASLLPAGREATGFRVAAFGGKGEIRLEDYRGRSVLLHFWRVGDADDKYIAIARECDAEIPKTELVILTVPVFDGAEAPDGVEEETAGFAWPVAVPSHVTQDAARAYGVEGISALFVVSPDGRILKSGKWSLRGVERFVRKLARDAAGPPLDERLNAVNSWAACRSLWHDLAARRHTKFAEPTWLKAADVGTHAYYALLLASAKNVAKRPEAKDLHGRLVAAWRKMRTGDRSAWDGLLAPLEGPNSDECLAVVDALFDLGLMGDEVREPLQRVAERSGQWKTVSMALRAIHFSDTATSPKKLRRHVRHREWQVRLALAEALRAYRHKHAVDILIQLLGDKRMRVRQTAADHLELLAGPSLGPSQKRWAKWRRAQGADLKLRPREVSVYRPYRPPDRKYAHRDYYGLQLASDRVVFVLDKSDSMYYGFFDGVVEEMQAHLESAGPTTKFNVIEFAYKPTPWGKKLVPANRANIDAAVAFLHRAKPYGPTNIIDALRLAMKTYDLDTVVLLSDGLPNKGTPSKPTPIQEAVRKVNRYVRVAINAVQLLEGRRFPHDGPTGKNIPPLDDAEKKRRDATRAWAPSSELGAFLRGLAAQNDGTYAVGFADSWDPPPGTKFRPNTDDE